MKPNKLEQIEAEMIRRLKQTEQREHEVFELLKTAMDDASKRPSQRLGKQVVLCNLVLYFRSVTK